MKSFILKIGLYILREIMNFIYFFMKFLQIQKNKVIMISRQSDNINIDFKLLKEEFETNRKMKVIILCKMIPKDIFEKFKYCFFILKCMYHLATSKICIVDGYVIPVCVLKHKKQLIVVQIWHAMGAIKKFGKQILNKKEGSNAIIANIMKMHKNYTYITCTSNITRKIYSEAFGVDIDKILVLGMPRVDILLNSSNREEELKKEYPTIKNKKIILYVPTFRKQKEIPIKNIVEKIDENKYQLIIRLHPLEKAKMDNKNCIDEKYSTMDLLKIADYVITDYSAIAFEAIAVDVPVFFYLYDIKEYSENRGLNIDLKEEMSSFTYQNIEDIINAIEKSNYNIEELKIFKNKYIQTINKNNTKQIVEYVLKENN